MVALGAACRAQGRAAATAARTGRRTHATAAPLQDPLRRHYDELAALSVDERLEQRYAKFRRMGHIASQA